MRASCKVVAAVVVMINLNMINDKITVSLLITVISRGALKVRAAFKAQLLREVIVLLMLTDMIILHVL